MKSVLIIVFVLLAINLVKCFEIKLNEGWTISNKNGSISIPNQKIPSGVYSALEEAHLTESVLFGYNDVQLRWIAHEEWTYSLTFNATFRKDYQSFLVFHGLDTNARIYLNGIDLGDPVPNNMFVRYRYDVSNRLESTNTLRIEFEPPIQKAKGLANVNSFTPPECPPEPYNGECHMNFLRKMQASFAWDWGLAAPSVGIWQGVSIENYRTAIIRDITYVLQEDEDSWIIMPTVHLESGLNNQVARGYLRVNLAGVLHKPARRFVSADIDENGEFSETFEIRIRKSQVNLWWPNGYGEQALYTLRAIWTGFQANLDTNEMPRDELKFIISKKSVRIGFRTLELIEETLSNGLSFYFKVNGIPIFMKGSNWIPSHILPEKSFDTETVRFLLGTVREAHMNMIRVWGGGIYETDYFYELADEYGILIWQDMMYACAMYPVFPEFLDSVRLEIKQNVRRLQSHPSVALWAGNNENEAALVQNWYGTANEFQRFSDEYIKLYDAVIKDEVLKNDQWRVYLYSSPSNGLIKSKEYIIHDNPQDWDYGDIHHYDYFSDGWNPNVYPKPRFVSEYGFQSFPDLNSWKSVLRSGDNLTDFVLHRQHFPMGHFPIIFLSNMHLPELNENNPNYWEYMTYFSQVNQAMIIKAETEVYRAGRGGTMHTMGALYWQLNDVWVAPSWSGIDYTGNFKILQYWVKDIFAPWTIIAHADILSTNVNLHVTRDTLGDPEDITVSLKIYKLDNLTPQMEKNWQFSMEENSAKLLETLKINEYFQSSHSRNNSIMWFDLKNSNGDVLASTFYFAEKVKNLIDIQDPQLKIEIINNHCENSYHYTQIKVTVEKPALFVYIRIEPIRKYKLTTNGFIQLNETKLIDLKFDNPNCDLDITIDDIKVLTMNEFMH